MSDVLNDADPAATVALGERVVRNLTAEEYEATYATGTVHGEGLAETDAQGVAL